MRRQIGGRRVPEGLGARVRRARIQLGLSLAAVAGSDFSRAFLHQVEVGKARPSTRTLQIIADRLGRSVEYFLQEEDASAPALELALVQAQARLHRGDMAGAEGLTGTLLRRQVPLEVRCRAQLTRARALLALGAVEAAISTSLEAIEVAHRASWSPLLVELYDGMGQAHFLGRRWQEAARWFDKALAEFERAGLTDPLLRARVVGHQASLHHAAGSSGDAIAAYESAIADADRGADMEGLAVLYQALATSLQQAGQLTAALGYSQRSLRAFETREDLRMAARLRLQMAEMLLHQGRPEEAEQISQEGVAWLEVGGEDGLRASLLGGAAEAALEQREHQQAADLIGRALEMAARSRHPEAQVEVERVAGRVAHALGRSKDARAHFERALEAAESAAGSALRSRVAYEFARVLEAEGDMAQAAARFREAYDARGRPLELASSFAPRLAPAVGTEIRSRGRRPPRSPLL